MCAVADGDQCDLYETVYRDSARQIFCDISDTVPDNRLYGRRCCFHEAVPEGDTGRHDCRHRLRDNLYDISCSVCKTADSRECQAYQR